jgi:TetR/AcrR family transcriptional repressor of nem operon
MTTMLKRDRLIEAAKAKFYQQGVARTTLADIAQHAQVPLGNVYYHFQTKEALVQAVVQAHMQELHSMFRFLVPFLVS